MENIRLIQLEWNKYNGIVIGLIGVNDRHLFSVNSSWKDFFIIELFFIRFKIYDKTDVDEKAKTSTSEIDVFL